MFSMIMKVESASDNLAKKLARRLIITLLRIQLVQPVCSPSWKKMIIIMLFIQHFQELNLKVVNTKQQQQT